VPVQLDDTRVALIDRMLDHVMVWLDGRPMGQVLMPFQRDILREFSATIRTDDGAPWYRRGLLHMAKKNAKTLLLILDAMITLHTDKPMGHKGCQIIYVANDQNQADENLDFTKKLYRVNPILMDEVQIKNSIIQKQDGTGYIEIVASRNVDALHGRSYRRLEWDELHAQTDYRLLEALELDPTRPDAQQFFASYSPLTPKPGTPIVDMLKQYHDGIDPRLFVFSRSGSIEEANPAMGGPLGSTKEEIEHARLRLPTWHWRRLFLNLSGQAENSAFDAVAIEACVAKGRHSLPPQPGISYRAFVDMSGGGADDSTLAVAHLENGKAILDVILNQGPPTGGVFSPDAAVKKFADVLRLYRCTTVQGDRFAGHWPRDSFAKYGIEYEVAEQTRSQIYAYAEPLINAGTVELLDHPHMIAQFVGLVRRGDKIDHQPSDHDDFSNAAAGALILASHVNHHQVVMYDMVLGRPLSQKELIARNLDF
jgi:hypothetical protein